MTSKSLGNKLSGSRQRPPLVRADDFLTMLGLSVFAVTVWIVPERLWPKLGRSLGPMAERVHFAGFKRQLAQVQAIAGNDLGLPPVEILRATHASHIERNLQLMRCYHPKGWRPRIAVEGQAQIEAALAAGGGAVLWDSHFTYSSLVSKMGLAQAGYAVSHMSHPRHGFSTTRFGMRFLNPIRTRIESRYLRERVVLGLDSPKAALQALDARLAENKLISVTVRGESRRPAKVPFLNGELQLAPGAPSLAYGRGAPLLPVYTLREPDGGFRVTVEAPIAPRPDESREAFFQRAAREYAARLEPYVARAPGQWLGWLDL